MTPNNRLKLNVALIAVLAFYWFLDRPIPDAVMPYDTQNIALSPMSSSPDKDLKQLTTDAEYIRKLTQAHLGQTSLIPLTHVDSSQAAMRLLIAQATQHIDLVINEWRIDAANTRLAAALLDATERGVKIRISIDDHNLNIADKTLFALARHPLISIRIFAPQHRVSNYAGTRLWDYFHQFKSREQNLREQEIIVDDLLAFQAGMGSDVNATGRDYLVAGVALGGMRKQFDHIWQHARSQDIADVFPEHPFILHRLGPRDKKINLIYQAIQAYASDNRLLQNSQANVLDRNALFESIDRDWTHSSYLYNSKPNEAMDLRVLKLINDARRTIQLQIPAPLFSDSLVQALAAAKQRGVRIQLLCDSMISNASARDFVRYRKQRDQLLAIGIQIGEFRPDFQATQHGIARTTSLMLIDQDTLYTGHVPRIDDHIQARPTSAFIITEPRLVNEVSAAFMHNATSPHIRQPQTGQPDQASSFWRTLIYRFLEWW